MTVPMIKSIGDVPYPIDTHLDAFSPLLTAGAALGINGNTTDSAAWLQRVSTTDGPTAIRSIHGRTLRWNQLCVNGNFSSSEHWSATTSSMTFVASDNEMTIASTGAASIGVASEIIDLTNGHKYYLCFSAKSDAALHLHASLNSGSNTINQVVSNVALTPTYQRISGIVTFATPSSGSKRVRIASASNAASGDSFVVKEVMLFDLTTMFGAGNEPSTIEEFTALYQEPYYPYDAGSLLPVNMTGIATTGFNQWDEEWEAGGINHTTGENQSAANVIRSKNYIPVIAGQNYYFNLLSGKPSTGMFAAVHYYDGNKAFLSYDSSVTVANPTFTVPSGACYMRFNASIAYGAVYHNNICINLSDPTRNGTYEPYWSQTRTIDVAAYFPDGMRSTGSVYDELTETQAITRIGERAYQSGDESDPTVVTDGTVTHYALATPTTVEIDPQLNLTYRTEQGGTERVMVPTGENSAPPTIVAAQGYTAESLRDAALSAIAPVENGKASTNYGVGSYLVHGGQLCKVTTAIATGESITIGTNVTATTVMAEVIALIAQ